MNFLTFHYILNVNIKFIILIGILFKDIPMIYYKKINVFLNYFSNKNDIDSFVV